MGNKADEGHEQTGSAIGVEALFRAHATFVAGFVTRLGATNAEVDDLVQEVFIVAHTKGGYQPGPAHPRTWLAAIAFRVVRAKQRSTARRREDPGENAFDAMTAAGKQPSEALEIAESLGRVQRALDALDLEHRAAFVLYEIEGESCQAIADALDIPVGTVYSRLYTARKRFLEAHELEGDGAPQAPRARAAGGV